MKEEIGFKHGIPADRNKTWERQVDGTTLVLSKTWEPKQKKFLYGCHSKAGGSGSTFYHSSDLDIEDLVKDERFSYIRGINGSKSKR